MDVREQVLSLAQQMIQRGGIDAVSFRTLADKIGIKSSSVHYHFPKKDDLLLEIAERYAKEFGTALTQIELTNPTAKARIRELAGLFRNTSIDGKVCYCAMLATSSSRLKQRSRASAQAFFKQLTYWVQSTIDQGISVGEFTLTVKSSVLAATIISALEGALLIDHLNGTNVHLNASLQLITEMLK